MENRLAFLVGVLLFFVSANCYSQEPMTGSCTNLVKKPYNLSPRYKAPDGTRGQGITIWVKGQLTVIPDTRPGCLPIALRYNNPGVLKTPRQGPWPGQIGKDDKSHAIFGSVEQGMAAWGLWMKRRNDSGQKHTAFSIMSMYAPPTDCVGSIGTPPNCPFGINPTLEYASRVAAAVNKAPKDPLNLDGTDCREGREALYALFQQIATFEIGSGFCGSQDGKSRGLCGVDRELFDKAMDSAFGPVQHGRCADPAEAHKN
jgi:hypothetical protein